MGIENEIGSDAAPLTAIVVRLTAEKIPLHGMRDVTRGGLATVLCELAEQYGFGALVYEASLPVMKPVRGLCDILGLDPLTMGNEGVMLLAVPDTCADEALRLIRAEKYGENAAVIGEVTESGVVLRTRVGGNRVLAPLIGEGLPRIC
jgi:hydrogenase expression/formation protein HypE